MTNPKLEIDAFLNDSDVLKAANRIQVQMDRIDTISQKTGLSQSAINKAIKEQEAAVKNSTMSWTDFRSMYQTVLDVARVGQAIWDETGKKFVDNAVAAGNMARNLGTTTEEASRLKEIADDVGISVTTLTTAFRTAQKDGFSPTIEGLAQMADEYNKLAPGIERSQFLQDRFGKGGEEMGKLLDKGSEAIRKNAAAISESMVVTQQGYEEARQYQIAVDSLNDSWDAFTYKVAPPLVNAMTTALNSQRDHIRALELMEEQGLSTYRAMSQAGYPAFRALAQAERESADASLLATEASEGAAGAFETEAEATARMADEARAAAAAIDETSRANQGLLGLIGSIQNEMDNYNGNLGEMIDKYGEGSEEVKKFEADHKKSMAKIATDLLIAKLSVGGLTDAEFEVALQAQLSAGLIDQATVDMAKSFDKAASQAANVTKEIKKTGDTAKAIAGTYNLNIVSNYVNKGVPPSVAAGIVDANTAAGTGGAPPDERSGLKTQSNGGGSGGLAISNYGTINIQGGQIIPESVTFG